MEVELKAIGPNQVELLREPMLALHRHEASIQPALGHAPVRSDDEFWQRYAEWFVRSYRIGDGFCIVALSGEQAVGMVFGVVREGILGFDAGERIGYIEDIAVLESSRGDGVGSALMERARSEFVARGLTSFQLSTVPNNDGARAFYAKFGLQPAAHLLIGQL
ncbi:MAG: GNAT family N-acetyltransferase [Solirubrobacterales bacterium]